MKWPGQPASIRPIENWKFSTFCGVRGRRASARSAARCERSARWAECARCLARRLEALPELRREVAAGRVSWSMGELLARVATPVDELHWLELAANRTVRQMRLQVAAAKRESAATGGKGGAEERAPRPH